ncbi:response regulator [Methylotenera sp.]|uniref:response regulator n=1 Tax=Methylotenera sp. TaxID=2051956 RepID=UPI00248A496E|nr:response regulator [Methylotenera sp.]MDI1300005.1 response regulator [Methylotenera sp.]
MRVLLVEDDMMIGEALQGGLRDASYAVDWLTNGKAALEALAVEYYDLVLLDLGLPGLDGLSVLSALRAKNHQVPVLIITARDGTNDRIRGLDCGADDYISKPFELSELLARMRAVLRRNNGGANTLLSNGLLTLDTVTHEVSMSDQAGFQLSNREYALLEALMLRPGAILSRSDLETRIYGWGEEVESNAVEFLIHALRKKLGSHVIKNLRGVGWMVSKAN